MSKWISVKDRLPKEKGFILLAIDDPYGWRVTMGLYHEKEDRWDCWIDDDQVCPTHWMPLPEPPK